MRILPPEIEESLSKLDPKDAARIRSMSYKELQKEERRLVRKSKELDAQLERATKEVRDIEDVIAFYEKGVIDRQNRTGGQ